MGAQPTSRPSETQQAGLILLALIAVAAGVLTLGGGSIDLPLKILAIVGGTIVVLLWLQKPVWAAYAALLLVLLPTGLIGPNLHSLLNRIITVAAAVVWLFDVLARDGRARWTPTAVLMTGFVGWSAVTLLWADNLSAGTTILQAYVLRLGLFLLIIPSQIRTRADVDSLMGVLALSGWILMATSAVTVLNQGYLPGSRFTVFETNENELGMLAMVALTGVLWPVIGGDTRRSRWLPGLGAALFVMGTIAVVAASGSRGSAISLGVMLLALSVMSGTRKWGLLACVLLALSVVSIPALFTTTLERFAVVRGDTLLGGREALWQAAWQMIGANPLAGVGIGNAPYAIIPHLRSLRSVLDVDKAPIHNPVLTILAETGLPGLMLYLGVLGTAIASFIREYLRRERREVSLPRSYFTVVAAIFLGYMASWIKGGGVESDHTYFLMLALLLIPACVGMGEQEGP